MSRFQMQYPPGSIRHRGELLDLIRQSQEENSEIALHAVEQSGYMTKYVMTPASRIEKSLVSSCGEPAFDNLTCYKTYNHTNRDKWFWDYILMGSYNIDNLKDNGCGVHRLFTNLKLAIEYSDEMKNDLEYINEVKRHHQEMQRLIRDFDF